MTGAIIVEDQHQVTLDIEFIGVVDVPVAQIKSRKKVRRKNVPKTATATLRAVSPTEAKAGESAGKRQRLEDLFARYKAGAVTLAVYQEQRALILAEPAKPIAPQPSLASVPPAAAAPKPSSALAQTPKSPEPAKPAAKISAPPPNPPKPKEPKRWILDLQLGMNLHFNQQDNELYSGIFKANYGGKRLRHIFNYNINYGKTDGIISANNMNGLIRSEFDVAKKVFVFNAAGAGYDDIRKIDFTYEESFGVGFTMVTLTNFVASIDAGLNYQEQWFSDGTSKEYFSPRFGEKAVWKISSKVELAEVFEFYPRSASLDNYRLRLETTLRYLLSHYLTLNLRVADLYDTQPAPGVTPNDLQIISTLGVRF